MRRIALEIGALFVAAALAGCMDDFDEFHTVPGAGGSGAAGGSPSGGSTTGGSAGTGGIGGALAGAGGDCGSLSCSGTCVDPASSDEHCGSCDNNCVLQGEVAGFRCVTGLCRCTSLEQCQGDGPGTTGVFCRAAAEGRCACNASSNICNYGEVCSSLTGGQQVCSCNGGSACFAGFVCCYAPSGCRDLQTDAENCGACGRACPSGSTCQSGQCQ
jgi:hypothetical protein